MPQIIPIKDLKNTSEISDMCHKTEEPIYVTKNGYGDMVIMSMEIYESTMTTDDDDRIDAIINGSADTEEMCDANEETTKIIETHMWPLTITKVPRSKEAFLVCFVDKIMALAETLKIIK